MSGPNESSSGPTVWFCNSVGGGVFGGSQVKVWRGRGLDAREHYSIALADYWKAKSRPLARVGLRWGMYVSYPWRLWRDVGRARCGDMFIAVTSPFFLPALAARAARKSGAKVVHLVYDLYPDALYFGGGWSPKNPAARFAASTTRRAIGQCAATVYLGDRLRAHAEATYGVAPRTAVIPVGTDAAPFAAHAPQARSRTAVRFLYSGHMGRLHDWSTLAQALQSGWPDSLEFEIASDGPGAVALKQSLQQSGFADRVNLAGTRGDAEWRAAMLEADVALVTMSPGAERVVMPSKTYSALAAGQAILAVCPRGSDLADLVAQHDCGWTIAPGDVAALRAVFAEIARDPGAVLAKRRRAFEAAHRLYSMEATGTQWLELLRSL